jgi:hypothetical protein
MAVRKQAGLWLVVGVVACVRGGGDFAKTWQEPKPRATSNAQAVASQSPVLRLQGDLSTVGKQAPLTLTAAMARRALRDGVLQVDLPAARRTPCAWNARKPIDSANGPSSADCGTPVSDQAMVLTFGGEACFGTLRCPTGARCRSSPTKAPRRPRWRADSFRTAGRRPANIARRSLAEVRTARYEGDVRARRTRRRPRRPSGNTLRATDRSPPAPVAGLVASKRSPPVHTHHVLAVYADDLVALRGSVAAVQTELSNKIAAANQAHIDSGTRVRLSLVATRKIAIPATMETTKRSTR